MALALGILALGFLIVVHEAGHYVVARWCKMRVERFSVGFGPGILKRKAKSGTIFQLAPIPFGGFVEIRGMNIAEEVDPDDVQAYPNRPAWQRFLTILAGPATNYVSAIFLAFALYTCDGMQTGESTFVGAVTDGYDAVGKLEAGDRIIAVDGKPMFSPDSKQLRAEIDSKPGKAIAVTVVRGDTIPLTFTITPKPQTKDGKVLLFNAEGKADEKGKPNYILGITLSADTVPVSVGVAAENALTYPVRQTKIILAGLHDIFTGQEDVDPGGPVRIVGEFKTAFSKGLPEGIRLLMMLSVYLGLFNLFPLPALDGGRLVFLTYEMVTRRRANPKIETMVHMGGIMVLMVVMILVTLRDIKIF